MLLLTSLCLLTLELTSSLTYEYVTSNRAVNFALASYCCGNLGHGVAKWECQACKRLPTVQNVTVFTTGYLEDDVNGFVAYDLDGGNGTPVIVIAFAGTDPLSIGDWIDDLDFIKVKYPACETEGCEVHKGFYDAYQKARDLVWNAVEKYQNAYGKDTPIQITGHSLGAALASHCSIDFYDTAGTRAQWIYTYGQPRVGNAEFATFYNSSLNANEELHFRVTHHKDPVPHLPEEWMGFYHMTLEVFYPSDPNGTYTVCNGSGEDKSCSDQYDVALDILDHLDYMGYSFTDNFISCKI